MQESVPEAERGVVGGVQKSLQSLMDMLTYVVGMVIVHPEASDMWYLDTTHFHLLCREGCHVRKYSLCKVKLLMASITPQEIEPNDSSCISIDPPKISHLDRKVLVSCRESNLLIKDLLQNFPVLWRINPTPISYSWSQKLFNHNVLFQYNHWFNNCRLMLILFLFFFQDFGITICMSFISVLIAAALYSLHVYRVRGHLFHFDRLLHSRWEHRLVLAGS